MITAGDPEGIGPEVMVKALRKTPCDRPVILLGDGDAIRRAISDFGPLPEGMEIVDTSGQVELPEVAAIRAAVDACLNGDAVAMVTGPINKEKLIRSGFAHTGHTDFLGELCGVKDPVMAFVGERLNVALVTVHCPLKEVPGRLTKERIIHVLKQTQRAFQRYSGTLHSPKLLVCGLNPHAGDGGFLGREELEVIGPAVSGCGLENVVGPISAEAAFTQAMKTPGQVVVAMYHDQGLAPLKAVEFGRVLAG